MTDDFDGVRYFIDAKMEGDNKGYMLIEDIEQARAFLKQYRDRAMTYHRTEAGMKLALEYMMDKQGVTGTLFERAG